MSSDLYGIQALLMNGTAFGGGKVGTFDRKREFLHGGWDGNPFETFHSIIAEKADISYTSVCLKQLLAAMGTSGTSDIPIVALDGVNGAEIVFAQAAASNPGYLATAVHESRKALTGFAVMEGVNWSLGQPAEMAIRIFGYSTAGTASAWTPSSARALPAQVYNTQALGLSGLTLNGNPIGSLQSLNLGIGHKFSYDMVRGLPHPMIATGAGPKGPLEIRLTAEVMNMSPTEGTGAVSMTFTNYLQAGAFGVTTVTFTLQGNWTTEDSLSASAGSPGQKRLTVFPYFDGTNFPLTWTIVN